MLRPLKKWQPDTGWILTLFSPLDSPETIKILKNAILVAHSPGSCGQISYYKSSRRQRGPSFESCPLRTKL